jgi:hypothetical protein
MASVPKGPVVSSLHWTGAGLKPVVFEMSGPSVLIGRREDCDLILAFGYISGHHARLVLSDGQWSIQDLGSTNGTRVNGRPAENTALNDGDQLSLGSLDMRFGKAVEPPRKSPAPTELADDTLNAGTTGTHTGTDWIHFWIRTADSNLSPVTGFTGDCFNDDGSILNFGNFQFEKATNKLHTAA